MKITEGKRLAAILGAYIGLFSLCVLVPGIRPYIILCGFLILTVFSSVLLFREKRKDVLLRKSVLLVLMALSVISSCVGAMRFLEKTEFSAARYIDGETHLAKGYVTGISYEESYGASYTVCLLELDKEETELGVTLSLPYNGELSVGDIVVFESVFTLSEEDAVIYRKADGIFLSSEAEVAKRTGVWELPQKSFFEKIRLSMQANFERYLAKDEAGFATAIMTGNRENLSSAVRLAFTRIGVSHILAVSGLHLAIVIGGLDLLFRLVAIPRKLKNGILIVCACLFACICGLSASVIRAAIMLSFMYLADTVGEKNDSLTSLFVAIFLILVFRPTAVYDVGMWMSFAATFGILMTNPVIPRIQLRRCPRLLNKILEFLLSLVCITVTASFFVLPIIYIAFDGISIFSPLANLLFVPLTQMVLYLLVALTLLGGVPFLASPLGAIAQTLIAFSCDTAEKLSDIRGIYISLRYPFVFWIIVFLVVGILTVLTVRKMKTVYVFGLFALCIAFYAAGYFGYMHMEGDNSYVYLETDGKSDALGIVSRGENVLVDISTGGYSVLSKAADRMEDFYACEIDALVLTHYHSHHPNSLRKLMNRVKIHRIYLPEPISENDVLYYRAIRDQLEGNAEITVYSADGTETLQIEAVRLSLSDVEYMKRSTHPIVRFSGAIGEKGFSYLGESATETDLSDYENEVMIFGSNGPAMHHIFDPEPLAGAELIVFAEKSHAELTDTEVIAGKIAFSEDYGGYIRILFE